MKIDNFFGATILMSDKADGTMRDNGPNILRFLRDSGMPEDVAPYVADLSHGNFVVDITPGISAPLPGRPTCDALVTNKRGAVLGIGFADCYPVFLVDEAKHAIGIAHCGWRGLSKDIIGKTLERMRVEYDTRPENVRALVGPGIERTCYPVGSDVHALFSREKIDSNGKEFLDLRAVIERALAVNGVRYIQYETDCTYCDLAASGHPRYYSGRRDMRYRLDKGALATNMAFITLP